MSRTTWTARIRTGFSLVQEIAEAASSHISDPEISSKLYQKAIEKGDIGWRSWRNVLSPGPVDEDASGFLGVLYALHKGKAKSHAALQQPMNYALQILSDETPDNNLYGYDINILFWVLKDPIFSLFSREKKAEVK